jgi:hypothetical protein
MSAHIAQKKNSSAFSRASEVGKGGGELYVLFKVGGGGVWKGGGGL